MTNESHYQVNHNEHAHSEITSSSNDLPSPSGIKKINEKLIDIDLFVDIESKPDFRPENRDLEGEILKSSVPVKSHPQYCTHTQYIHTVHTYIHKLTYCTLPYIQYIHTW